MSKDFRAIGRECATGSAEGRTSFGDVVGMLTEAGVERYHVDFMRAQTTYYLPNGEFETIETPLHGATAREFSAAGIEAALRGVQTGALTYPAFCAKAQEAGCVGYIVSVAGRRVVYYGRTGDLHIEHFPAGL